MSLTAPYMRTIRPFRAGDYDIGATTRYVRDASFIGKQKPDFEIFYLIQQDVLKLFEFIEPSDKNCPTYSHRISSLLTTICIETESQFKSLLRCHGHNPSKFNMIEYSKVQNTHCLSDYKIRLPRWIGELGYRRPFKDWSAGRKLNWYQSYNETKHDRRANFELATFDCVIDAYCGLFALLSAQFFVEHTNIAQPIRGFARTNSHDGFEYGIGNYLQVQFPKSWSDEEKYATFDHQSRPPTNDPWCQQFNYAKIDAVKLMP